MVYSTSPLGFIYLGALHCFIVIWLELHAVFAVLLSLLVLS